MSNAVKSMLVAFALMVSATGAGSWMRPTHMLADSLPPIKLESLVPTKFGDWVIEEGLLKGVVNPQLQANVDKLYSETLTRSYINTHTGQRVMLSIAYGREQNDAMQVHKPEICYPAQGFMLASSQRTMLQTKFGGIPVKRIETVFAEKRYEPVTYWTTLYDKAISGGINFKLEQMKFSLRGLIPDGLLFRISSIDRDTAAAYALQDAFVTDMLPSLTPEARKRLAGLSGN